MRHLVVCAGTDLVGLDVLLACLQTGKLQLQCSPFCYCFLQLLAGDGLHCIHIVVMLSACMRKDRGTIGARTLQCLAAIMTGALQHATNNFACCSCYRFSLCIFINIFCPWSCVCWSSLLYFRKCCAVQSKAAASRNIAGDSTLWLACSQSNIQHVVLGHPTSFLRATCPSKRSRAWSLSASEAMDSATQGPRC